MTDVLDRIDRALVTLLEAGPTDRSRRRVHRSRPAFDTEWTVVSFVHERVAPPTDVASQTAVAA